MLKEHAKLLLLLQKAGTITGRKKLQKIIYIAKKFQFDFQEKYNFHVFGPYSEELSVKIEELTNLGFVEEVKEKKGGYFQYKYELSEQGRQYLQALNPTMEGLDPFLQALNRESSRFLELVSTALYFDKLEREALKEKIKKVKSKQKYTDEEIEKAFQYILQLRGLCP